MEMLMLGEGPALWNNVLELHAKRPFHCMIGGGDQIYNDGVRVSWSPYILISFRGLITSHLGQWPIEEVDSYLKST
jgi:hypothetical protein